MTISITFLIGLFGVTNAAFESPASHRPRLAATSILSMPYGRGAAIWPESSKNPVLLADSFPGGVLPDIAQEELRLSVNEEHEVIETPRRRRRLPRVIQRILRRAAVKEEDAEYDTVIDKTPAVIALSLLMGGLVLPVDVLVVVFLSGYLTILGMASRVVRSDGVTPSLPSLPPQGHVPVLVSNPLGNAFTNSDAYDLWLRFGSVSTVLAPIALLGWYVFLDIKHIEAAKFCARPAFLLCCQAVSESISRKVMVSPRMEARLQMLRLLVHTNTAHFQAPLPIRILVPIAYNTVRLAPLWSWALAPIPLGILGRMVAMTNLIYWALNLFAFLLPIASLRYMRAHFFNVEAEQVTIRPGMESSIGLLP